MAIVYTKDEIDEQVALINQRIDELMMRFKMLSQTVPNPTRPPAADPIMEIMNLMNSYTYQFGHGFIECTDCKAHNNPSSKYCNQCGKVVK